MQRYPVFPQPAIFQPIFSGYYDSEDASERDRVKNKLFKLAGSPLIRIRVDDIKAVRAEDFYDLLVAQSEKLDVLRPRRTHDSLVPV